MSSLRSYLNFSALKEYTIDNNIRFIKVKNRVILRVNTVFFSSTFA